MSKTTRQMVQVCCYKRTLLRCHQNAGFIPSHIYHYSSCIRFPSLLFMLDECKHLNFYFICMHLNESLILRLEKKLPDSNLPFGCKTTTFLGYVTSAVFQKSLLPNWYISNTQGIPGEDASYSFKKLIHSALAYFITYVLKMNGSQPWIDPTLVAVAIWEVNQ